MCRRREGLGVLVLGLGGGFVVLGFGFFFSPPCFFPQARRPGASKHGVARPAAPHAAGGGGEPGVTGQRGPILRRGKHQRLKAITPSARFPSRDNKPSVRPSVRPSLSSAGPCVEQRTPVTALQNPSHRVSRQPGAAETGGMGGGVPPAYDPATPTATLKRWGGSPRPRSYGVFLGTHVRGLFPPRGRVCAFLQTHGC